MAGVPFVRVTCPNCSWDVDLDGLPSAELSNSDVDDGVLLTDGGGTQTQDSTNQETNPPEKSARDVLDRLHYDDRAANLAEYLETGGVELELQDVLRPLGLAEGDLCIEVSHESVTEYIWLDDEWTGFVSQSIKTDGSTWPVTELDRNDLERRLSKSIDVCLSSNAPIDGPGGE